MLVGKRMKREPVTVTREESLRKARELLDSRRIRHLPVVEGKRLVGIITDRDIQQASPSSTAPISDQDLSEFLERVKVGEVMVSEVVTTSPFTSIEEAAKVMQERKIGCLPVLDRGELVGIITETDILGVLVEVMGIKEASSRLEVELPDRPGALATVAQIIKKHNINICSVLTVPSEEPEKRVVLIRVNTINPTPLIRAIEEAGFRVLPAYEV